MAEPDLYEILGVSRGSSDSEIKKVKILILNKFSSIVGYIEGKNIYLSGH